MWTHAKSPGTVAYLHSLGVPGDVVRAVRWCEPTNRSLVLGRAQDASNVNTASIDVVRRNSGGGAVLIVPGEMTWFDVVLPATDLLWHPDVGQSFWWLGDVIAATLTTFGRDAAVHKGAFEPGRWAKQVCFAGLGPGEVTVDGAKAVGISQKRTRAGAVFQCSFYSQHRTVELAALLGLNQGEKSDLMAHLERHVVALPEVDPASFAERFAALLPQ